MNINYNERIFDLKKISGNSCFVGFVITVKIPFTNNTKSSFEKVRNNKRFKDNGELPLIFIHIYIKKDYIQI